MRRLLLGAVVLYTVSCAGTDRWHHREAFFAVMQCNLSVDAVESLAARHGGEGWICHSPADRRTVCNFTAGRTRVTVEFEDGKATSIEDGDQFGVTGMAMRPKIDLCSGARSRAITILPRDASWIGAVITADDRPIGTITAEHAQNLYVPLGRIVLGVSKAGRDRVHVPLTVPGGTLRKPPVIRLPQLP